MHAKSEPKRLRRAEFIVSRVAAIGGLRPGLTTERAVAAALVFMDPAVYRTLRCEHGRTRPECANWIERVVTAKPLGDTSNEA